MINAGDFRAQPQSKIGREQLLAERSNQGVANKNPKPAKETLGSMLRAFLRCGNLRVEEGDKCDKCDKPTIELAKRAWNLAFRTWAE
jgi:hypothetical protein